MNHEAYDVHRAWRRIVTDIDSEFSLPELDFWYDFYRAVFKRFDMLQWGL